MTTFLMETDARARKVAKDLKAICQEKGIKLPLTKSQAATARLYGYPSWNDLLTSLGKGHSPDDHELDVQQLEDRRSMQAEALVSIGIPAADTQVVLSRLAPTGRTESTVKSSDTVALVQHLSDYHPIRFMEAMDLAHHHLKDWDGRLMDLEDRYAQWLKGRNAIFLDRMLGNAADSIEAVHFLAEWVSKETGYVIDACANAVAFSEVDALDATWSPEIGPSGFHYIHFGPHRFPSPFPRLGVEGCYIHYRSDEDEAPGYFSFTFMVSEEVGPEDDLYDKHLGTMPSIRNLLRRIDVSFSPLEGETLGACISDRSGGEYPDEYARAWVPYLKPLLNAAWNSLTAYTTRQLPIVDALYVDLPREDIRKLQRARTEKRRLEVMRELAEDSIDMAIRYMGRTPPSRDLFSERGSCPYPRADSGIAGYDVTYVQSLLEDAMESWRPIGMLWHARTVDDLVRPFLDGYSQPGSKPDAEFVVARQQHLRAVALMMNAEWVIEEHEAALSSARYLLDNFGNGLGPYLPGIVKLFIEAGDLRTARDAYERFRSLMPESGLKCWTEALIAASAGNRENALRSLVRAIDANPQAVHAIMGSYFSPWSWFFRDLEEPGGDDEADHVGCLHGTTWKMVNGWEELLEEAVVRHATGTETARPSEVTVH